MPTLRNKSTESNSSQDQSSTTLPDQHDEEQSKSISPSKVKTERAGSPGERPASPRRLRDRRLLAGFKPDTSASASQTNTPVKSSTTANQKNDNSKSSAATGTSSTKRPPPSTPSSDSQQPPKSMMKRSLSKSESLLVRMQPSDSKSTSVLPSSRNQRVNSLLASAKHHAQRRDSSIDKNISSDQQSSSSSRTHAKSASLNKTMDPDKQKSCSKTSSSGLNLTTNKSNKSGPSRDHSHSSSSLKNVRPTGQQNTHKSSTSGSSTSNHQQSRASLNKQKPVRMSSLPGSKDNCDDSFPPLKQSSLSLSDIDSPINFSEQRMLLDQMGPINMTKVTSRTRSFNVLVAVTGSVAAIKLVEFIKKLRLAFPRSFTDKEDNQTYKATIAIKVVMTENSKHFISKEEFVRQCSALRVEVFDDADEWSQWNRLGDPVLHIELRKWADLCVIAPLDANTMAKLSNGICDNLLTCTVRAWDASKPLLYCPAMNVHMYDHPITREQLNRLQTIGYQRVDCIQKRLACGDFGMGAMAPIDTIVDRVVENLTGSAPRFSQLLRPQQPTYPLLTTSAPSSSSLLDRIKAASQRNTISMHGIDINNQTLEVNLPVVTPANLCRNVNPISSIYQHQMPTEEDGFSDKNQDDLDRLRNEQFPGMRASDIVTSLQNLKAIDFGGHLGGDSDFDEPDGDLHNGSEINRNQPNNLVQALVSSSLIESADQIQHKSSSSFTNGAGAQQSNGGPMKIKGSALDPSAFISYCYNKNRNCFTCIMCKNDYKNRKSMSRHLKEQHLQGNIHRCSPCGVSYKRREKLIKHNREHHGLVDSRV